MHDEDKLNIGGNQPHKNGKERQVNDRHGTSRQITDRALPTTERTRLAMEDATGALLVGPLDNAPVRDSTKLATGATDGCLIPTEHDAMVTDLTTDALNINGPSFEGPTCSMLRVARQRSLSIRRPSISMTAA